MTPQAPREEVAVHEGDFAVHQEHDVIASGTIVRVTLVALLVGAVGVGVAGLVLRASGPETPQGAPAVAPRSIASIEQTPIWQAEDGLALRAQQRAELRTWGWADRDAGLARIPIERAKDLVVERAP